MVSAPGSSLIWRRRFCSSWSFKIQTWNPLLEYSALGNGRSEETGGFLRPMTLALIRMLFPGPIRWTFNHHHQPSATIWSVEGALSGNGRMMTRDVGTRKAMRMKMPPPSKSARIKALHSRHLIAGLIIVDAASICRQ